MRILFLTPQLPYPPHQGTSLRNYNLIKHLAPRHEIYLLSFLPAGDMLASESPLHRLCREIVTVPAPTRSRLQRAASVFTSRLPDMALRLPSPEFHAQLAALWQRVAFDVVQVEGLEMAQYGMQRGDAASSRRTRKGFRAPPRFREALRVFDDHNAEYVLQRSAFQSDARQVARWVGAAYSLLQWQKLARYEREACQRHDRVVVVSEADRAALLQLAPDLDITVVPNGVDTEYFKKADGQWSRSPFSAPQTPLVFTGKMDFRPNVDAALWFADEILPLIRREIPDAHFWIVGQSPHSRLVPLASRSDVTLTGRVEDIRPYIAEARVFVVPLRMGGGTRLKVLQAMAMGKAIVSTRLGCEGIAMTPGREALWADTPAEFARAAVALLRDAARRAELGAAARRLAESKYDWKMIVPRVEDVYLKGDKRK